MKLRPESFFFPLHIIFQLLGHHRVMEAARGALVTMVLKW